MRCARLPFRLCWRRLKRRPVFKPLRFHRYCYSHHTSVILSEGLAPLVPLPTSPLVSTMLSRVIPRSFALRSGIFLPSKKFEHAKRHTGRSYRRESLPVCCLLLRVQFRSRTTTSAALQNMVHKTKHCHCSTNQRSSPAPARGRDVLPPAWRRTHEVPIFVESGRSAGRSGATASPWAPRARGRPVAYLVADELQELAVRDVVVPPGVLPMEKGASRRQVSSLVGPAGEPGRRGLVLCLACVYAIPGGTLHRVGGGRLAARGT